MQQCPNDPDSPSNPDVTQKKYTARQKAESNDHTRVSPTIRLAPWNLQKPNRIHQPIIRARLFVLGPPLWLAGHHDSNGNLQTRLRLLHGLRLHRPKHSPHTAEIEITLESRCPARCPGQASTTRTRTCNPRRTVPDSRARRQWLPYTHTHKKKKGGGPVKNKKKGGVGMQRNCAP
jgi:hypothetical protein